LHKFSESAILLIVLNKRKSRRGKIVDTHVFDHVPGQFSRKKTTFKDFSVRARAMQNGLFLPTWTSIDSHPCW
jgi:hypothetical protein